MKIKIFTLTTFAMIALGLTSCKKLTSNTIAVNSSAISAKFKSSVITRADIDNKLNNLAVFVDKNVNVDSNLQIGVNIADVNGFVASKTEILEGKITTVTIKNYNNDDNRSFYEFYTKIEKVYVKFSKADYNATEELTEANGYRELCDEFILTPTDIKTLTIPISIEKQKSLKTFLNEVTPTAQDRTNMIVVIKGQPKMPIELGSEFNLQVDALTTLNLTQKAK